MPPVATLTLQVNSIEMKDKFDSAPLLLRFPLCPDVVLSAAAEHMYVVVAAGGHAAVFPYKDAGRITTLYVISYIYSIYN
mgnify:CR=1 FL=1